MKKLLFITVFFLAALIVNAQRTPVKSADLLKGITENVAKDYAGFTIKNATKVVANNVTTFEVVVVKGTTSETLLYDNTGKFTKKVTVKSGTTEKKEVKPVQKPAAKPAAAAAPAKKN
jgi:hypothetical protein